MNQLRKYVTVRPDIMTSTLTVPLPGDGSVFVPAKEVIEHLGSKDVAERTRERIWCVEPVVCAGEVTAVKVGIRGPFKGGEDVDVEQAANRLFEKKAHSQEQDSSCA